LWRGKATGGVSFCGDKTGLRSDEVRGRSYAPRGRTPTIRVAHKRVGLGLISAVVNKGELRWMVLDGVIKAPGLIRFFGRLVRDVGRNIFLILDRLPIHRSAKIRAWLAGREADIAIRPEATTMSTTWRQYSSVSVSGSVASDPAACFSIRYLQLHLCFSVSTEAGRITGATQANAQAKGRKQGNWEQKRLLIELVARAVVTNSEIEICHMIPTSPTGSAGQLCYLHSDFRAGLPLPQEGLSAGPPSL
jgi:hypothetical protein